MEALKAAFALDLNLTGRWKLFRHASSFDTDFGFFTASVSGLTVPKNATQFMLNCCAGGRGGAGGGANAISGGGGGGGSGCSVVGNIFAVPISAVTFDVIVGAGGPGGAAGAVGTAGNPTYVQFKDSLGNVLGPTYGAVGQSSANTAGGTLANCAGGTGGGGGSYIGNGGTGAAATAGGNGTVSRTTGFNGGQLVGSGGGAGGGVNAGGTAGLAGGYGASTVVGILSSAGQMSNSAGGSASGTLGGGGGGGHSAWPFGDRYVGNIGGTNGPGVSPIFPTYLLVLMVLEYPPILEVIIMALFMGQAVAVAQEIMLVGMAPKALCKFYSLWDNHGHFNFNPRRKISNVVHSRGRSGHGRQHIPRFHLC